MTVAAIAPPQFTVDFKRNPRYMLGDSPLLGVTDVLRDNGFINPAFFTEEGRSRGSAVHHATFLFDQGTLRWETLDPELHGYVHSWGKLKQRLGVDVLMAEYALYTGLYMIGGTLDRVVRVGQWEHVWDIKVMPPNGGSPPKWARYQIAAYDGMLPPYERGVRRRATVALYADGAMPTLTPHEDFQDFHAFLAMATATRARVKCGIKGGVNGTAG